MTLLAAAAATVCPFLTILCCTLPGREPACIHSRLFQPGTMVSFVVYPGTVGSSEAVRVLEPRCQSLDSDSWLCDMGQLA